jgi:cell division protein FtsN
MKMTKKQLFNGIFFHTIVDLMEILYCKTLSLISIKGGSMLPGKLLVTGVLATLLVGGCVQKKPQSRKNTTQPPKTVSTPVLKDTTDIFDEFYKDEAASKSTPEQTSGAKTFSTSSSSKRKVSVPSGQIVENGPYVLQVSTVRSKKLADKVASQLEGMGFPSYVAEVQSPTPSLSGTFYRVRVGGFSSGPSARAFGESTLKDAGFDFWVDKRANDNIGIDGSGMGSSGSSYSGSSSYSSGSSSYSSTPSTYSATPAVSQPAATTTPAAVTPAPASKPESQPATSKPGGTGSVPDTSGWDSAW